jgi:hypothetical protein
MMLNEDNFLVIDRLSSMQEHTYEQMFHLFPGAELRRDGLTVVGTDGTSERSVTIRQLDTSGATLSTAIGEKDPLKGWHSTTYEACEPSHAISYTARGRTAAYTTLISAGPADPQFSVSYDKPRERLEVLDHGRVLLIDLTDAPGSPLEVKVSDPDPPGHTTQAIRGLGPWSRWTSGGDGTSTILKARKYGVDGAMRLSAANGTPQAVNDSVRADLSRGNLHVRTRVVNPARLSSFRLELSNSHWSSSCHIDLRSSIASGDSGKWMTISLGRSSSLSRRSAHWSTEGGAFSWRDIDGMRVTITAVGKRGPPPLVDIDFIRTAQQQRRGAVVFCFDDGYESIIPAAEYMHANEMPGNVGVIGDRMQLPVKGYLNELDLRMLQDEWGWNIVNHTQHHLDIVKDYYDPKRDGLAAFEQDVVDGMITLERAGLNSAPNWFVYPRGDTNDALKDVVGRYYKFARTTCEGPEAFPFGSPLRVKTLNVRFAGEYSGVRTAPSEVIAAVRDARRYRTLLIVTLHRIKTLPSDRPGYPLADFKRIVDGVKRAGVPVLTFSELDEMNGVSISSEIEVGPAVPPTIEVAITDATPWHTRAWTWVMGLL